MPCYRSRFNLQTLLHIYVLLGKNFDFTTLGTMHATIFLQSKLSYMDYIELTNALCNAIYENCHSYHENVHSSALVMLLSTPYLLR
jgi:hypothetical protein